MPYRTLTFEKHHSYHILSRTVEQRKIFEKEEDCYRFIFQIYAANIGKPAYNLQYRDIVKAAKNLLQGEQVSSKVIISEHLPLVDILDFSLVIDHYHFYLVSNIENGVPIFMKKLNGGFAMFFNLKYGRKGSLFGSRYKSIPIKTQYQSDAVSRYVSVINPLDVFKPGWRENNLENWEEAFKFLENYQFSSFPDKIGKRNCKILASKEILEKYSLGEKNQYIEFVKDFLKQKLTCSELFLE